MRLLHTASKFVNDRRILTQLYYTHIRCRLEQSAVLCNSSLTLESIVDLERVQKTVLQTGAEVLQFCSSALLRSKILE